MIFVSTSCLAGRGENRFEPDLYHILDKYKNAGIENVELGAALAPFDILKLYKMKHDFNFIVHCYFPPLKERIMMNLASGDGKLRKTSLDIALNAIDICRRLDSDLYTLHPGARATLGIDIRKDGVTINNAGNEINYEKAYENFKESLLTILEKAMENKIRIAIENVPSMLDISMFSKVEEFERIFREVKHKDFGMLLDLGHLELASAKLGFDKQDFIDSMQHKIFEMHCHEIKDGIDHNMITSTKIFDGIDKSVLKRVYKTIEVNDISIEQIKKAVEIVEEVD